MIDKKTEISTTDLTLIQILDKMEKSVIVYPILRRSLRMLLSKNLG